MQGGGVELPGDVEHRVHELLRIAEVCALRRVSTSWRARICGALEQAYRWDLTHIEGVDVEAHNWLEHLSKAGIKIRTLRVENLEAAARCAANSGFAGAIRMLIAHCPSTTDFLHVAEQHGMTPLHYAAAGGHRDVVELLLGAPSVDVNAGNNHGETPLHFAAIKGHRDVVKLLLAVPKVDVNAEDCHGYTPLYCAAIQGHRHIVELLLAAPNVDVDYSILDTAALHRDQRPPPRRFRCWCWC